MNPSEVTNKPSNSQIDRLIGNLGGDLDFKLKKIAEQILFLSRSTGSRKFYVDPFSIRTIKHLP